MKSLVFEFESFDEFINWKQDDSKIFNKIVNLIKDARRHPFTGLGKPEPLKHTYKGCWSRRITDEHRLVYKVTEESIIIVSCKYHY